MTFASAKIILILLLLLATVSVAAPRSSVRLAWDDNSDNEKGFHLWRCTPTTPWKQIAITPFTTFLDTNLLSGTTYMYQVRAYNDTGVSAFSNQLIYIAGKPKGKK
jgi:hypothetical protein